VQGVARGLRPFLFRGAPRKSARCIGVYSVHAAFGHAPADPGPPRMEASVGGHIFFRPSCFVCRRRQHVFLGTRRAQVLGCWVAQAPDLFSGQRPRYDRPPPAFGKRDLPAQVGPCMVIQ